MRTIKIILLAVGIFLEIGAYVISQADNMPTVYRLLSPNYYSATRGMDILDEKLVLYPNDEGYEKLTAIFMEEILKRNPVEKVVGVKVETIQREKAVIAYTTKRAKEKIPIVFLLSNGQKIEWELDELMAKIMKLKSTILFTDSAIIFVIGIILIVTGSVIDIRREK